jgi:hypothetical protein
MNTSTIPSSPERRTHGRYTPLQLEIERILREFDYEICGDEDHEGWYWRLENYDSRQSSHAHDSIELATLSALRDFADRSEELQAAAAVVVDTWEAGDLAGAVRGLELCLRAMKSGDEADEEASGEEPAVILGADGVQIGRQTWLVHGDSADGPWLDAVHLQLEAAIARARAIGQEWLDEGLNVDLDELEASVRAGSSYSPRDGFAVGLSRVDVIGDAASVNG